MIDLILVSRSLERISIIGGAILSIYLGYRLIMAMPQNRDGQGKITLPLGSSIFLSRLGPGAFFSLFGCIVLVFSLQNALTVKAPREEVSATSGDNLGDESYIHYLQNGEQSVLQDFDWLPKDVFKDLYLLNQLPAALSRDLDPELQSELKMLAVRGKLVVLHPYWHSSWCSETAFREWIHSGMKDSPPENFEEPIRLYNYGKDT